MMGYPTQIGVSLPAVVPRLPRFFRMMRRYGCLGLFALLAGCAVGPNYSRPKVALQPPEPIEHRFVDRVVLHCPLHSI